MGSIYPQKCTYSLTNNYCEPRVWQRLQTRGFLYWARQYGFCLHGHVPLLCLEELNHATTARTGNFINQGSRRASLDILVESTSKRLTGANQVSIWEKSISGKETGITSGMRWGKQQRKKKAVGEEQEGEEGLRNKPHPMASWTRMSL